MIIEHLLNDDQLTNTEKSLASYLLNKENNIHNLTSRQLGELSYTSQGAVTRLYKKLGFQTYREFISTLILERRDYFKYHHLSNDYPEQYFTTLDDIEDVIASIYEKTMFQTNLLLDQNVINRVVNRILSASHIDIYGIGITETTAKELYFKFQILDLPCQIHNGANVRYLERIRLQKNNVSILISTTGNNEIIADIAKRLSSYQIYTVGIVSAQGKKVAEYCQDVICFDTSLFRDVDTLCSTFAAGYIVNILYAALFYRFESEKYLKNDEKICD